MTELDKELNRLKKGQSIVISGDKEKWVTAERSGNGKILRFIRNTPNSFEVFKTCSY